MSKVVKVLESVYTISGRILVLLESDYGRPATNGKLCDEYGLTWIITNNSLFIDPKIVAKLPDKDCTFFCELEGLGHEKRPEASTLQILED